MGVIREILAHSKLTSFFVRKGNNVPDDNGTTPSAMQDIAATAVSLFNQLNECRSAVRSITICAGRIQTDTCQADLFDGDGEGRQRALGRSIAAIRRRSGFGAILPAATLPVYQSDLAARAGSPPGGSD